MQAQNYSIKAWAEDDRPREKLLSKTPEVLSNSELLAILIRNGTRRKTAVDLAREVLLLGKNNLDELGRLSLKDLMKIKGIGMAKAATIAAALELGRRRQGTYLLPKSRITDTKEVARCLKTLLKDFNMEVLAVLFLNRGNRVKHFEILSKGGITGTIADPRIILRRALESGAVNIVLCHNHPSGSLKPSRADEEITSKIQGAARLFDIKLLDHIIVSNEGFYSFADEGLI